MGFEKVERAKTKKIIELGDTDSLEMENSQILNENHSTDNIKEYILSDNSDVKEEVCSVDKSQPKR